MISEDDLIATVADLTREDLKLWIESGWVQPPMRRGRCYFREVDVARVRLIVAIRQELEVEPDDLPLVLSLIDQIYGLRRQLKRLACAIDAEPDPVKSRIADRIAAG